MQYALRERAPRSHGHLLAQNRTHRNFKAIQAARHAHARAAQKPFSESRINRRGIGIQVKRSAQPRNQERQRGRERIAHAHAKQMRLIIQAAMQPAAQHAALVHEAEAAHDAGELIFKAFWAVSRHRICVNCYEFHSI